ncbi:divalent-cation tolerance protein CutA [Thermosphaera chiliense]|uniref:Divalent-cation tolerance protein CutA n=1 Tax=Thermosphaera chiliense TaxID=3402707 RepID=A0A7M1UTC8_9CREN|nr:divalent-cation tolerance protein CutA [Thermosphaera aggregans]
MEGGWVVVLITASTREEALKIGRMLVEAKLAACVNIVRDVTSIYWWEGKVEEGGELLLIVKTTFEKLESLIKEVRKIHSYSVPEIIAIPVVAGNPDYLRWVRESTS